MQNCHVPKCIPAYNVCSYSLPHPSKRFLVTVFQSQHPNIASSRTPSCVDYLGRSTPENWSENPYGYRKPQAGLGLRSLSLYGDNGTLDPHKWRCWKLAPQKYQNLKKNKLELRIFDKRFWSTFPLNHPLQTSCNKCFCLPHISKALPLRHLQQVATIIFPSDR